MTTPYPKAPKIEAIAHPRRRYLRIILTNLTQGKLKNAVRYTLKLVKFSNEYGGAWYDLGKALEQRSDRTGAESAYRQAIALSPNQPWPHYALGKLWHYRGQQEQRSHLWQDLERTAYQRVTELEPSFFWGWQDLGEALVRCESWDEAIAAFEKAAALDGGNPWPMHHMGNCQRALGNWNGAIAAYQKSIELNPDFPWNYVALGDVLGEQNRWADASEAYQQAIAIDAKLPDVSQKLINSLAKQTDLTLDQAVRTYRQSIQGNLDDQLHGDFLTLNSNLDSAAHYQAVGDRLLSLERAGEAIAYYKIALSLEPHNTAAQTGLANARQTLQRAAPAPVQS